jgi:hypothetical protein
LGGLSFYEDQPKETSWSLSAFILDDLFGCHSFIALMIRTTISPLPQSSSLLPALAKGKATKVVPTAPLEQRKEVRFDDYDDFLIVEPPNADDIRELWWSRLELETFRLHERRAARSAADSSIQRYLDTVARAHAQLSRQNQLSKDDLKALVESLQCGRHRGLEYVLPSSIVHSRRIASIRETVTSIVSVHERLHRLVRTCGSGHGGEDFDFDALSWTSSSSTSSASVDSECTGRRGMDISRMVRSHSVALTQRNRIWASTLGMADQHAVDTER